MKPAGQVRLLVAGLIWPPETFLARLFRGLTAAGIQLSVASSERPTDEWLALPNFSWLPVRRSRGPKSLQTLETLVASCRAAFRSVNDLRYFSSRTKATNDWSRLEQLQSWLPFVGHNWDVIYFPWNSGAIAHIPLFERAPSVVSCRGAQVNIAPHNPERAAIREGLRETFAKAAAVHCVSTAIRDEAKAYGLDPDKAVVIRPAVDPDYFHPLNGLPIDKGQFRIVTTGSLIWRKGYEYMLAGLRQLVDRGIPAHLTIIGDGPERWRLLYTVHDLKLNSVVEICGQMHPEQVRQRLQKADVFLLSSLSEGISNAVLEGMACGLPVVTSAVGGMAEAVTDGVEGFVVQARDPHVMAEALANIWYQPELRRTMGNAARARIISDFRLDQQIEAFVTLFRGVAN
jgi:glycosyltransferase involved in cell wall biosynthesis